MNIKTYLGISNISYKFLPISLEVGPILTAGVTNFARDFLQKSLLDPQYVLSLEIFGGFFLIKFMVSFRFRVRVYCQGFGVGLGITNSKKIKKMGNRLEMTYFTRL